jgi:pectate lyase
LTRDVPTRDYQRPIFTSKGVLNMRRAAIVMALAAVSLAPAGLVAQAIPSFAGKWTVVDAGGGQGAGPGGLGQDAVVVQDATTMTVTRTTPMGEVKSVYKLDGSESRNTFNFNGTAIDQVSKVKWSDGKLLINTSMNFDGNTVEVSMTMSLDPSGTLSVETTRPDFQGGGAPVTTKTTYKKG